MVPGAASFHLCAPLIDIAECEESMILCPEASAFVSRPEFREVVDAVEDLSAGPRLTDCSIPALSNAAPRDCKDCAWLTVVVCTLSADLLLAVSPVLPDSEPVGVPRRLDAPRAETDEFVFG